MSVLLETSLGDLVIDLDVEQCPRSSTNFLKLCAKHYYKLNAFFRVEKDFTAQTGDPTDTGKGGDCIWSQLPSTSADRTKQTYFRPESSGQHTRKGTVSFACSALPGDNTQLIAGSQFFITLTDKIDYLDGKHAPFGTVVEGQEPGGTLDKINETFVDAQKCPLKDIRIRHIVVLEDPFIDPDGFTAPSRSPSPTPEQMRSLRLADEEEAQDQMAEPDPDQVESSRRTADSTAAALTLEMVGDLPFAEIRPPENILFVCKLNPVTQSDDLELLFSRFGTILSCQVIKDKRTGDSLQYAFIEFDRKEDAERAYFKMQNVLIDDRRIWVDFSQSVSQLHANWVTARTGKRQSPSKPSRPDSRRLNDRDLSRTEHSSRRDYHGHESSDHRRKHDDNDRDRKRSRYESESRSSHKHSYSGSRSSHSSRSHDRPGRHRHDDRHRERPR